MDNILLSSLSSYLKLFVLLVSQNRCMIEMLSYMLQDDEDALLEGEKEAEKMILEAYSALLLAFLSTERSVFFPWLMASLFPWLMVFSSHKRQSCLIDSRCIRDAIAECLPDHKLAILVPVLERFVVCII